MHRSRRQQIRLAGYLVSLAALAHQERVRLSECVTAGLERAAGATAELVLRHPALFCSQLFRWTQAGDRLSPMPTGRQLRKLFQQFNEKYFNGRLPNYAIRVVGRIVLQGQPASGHCDRGKRLIRIVVAGLPDENVVSALLHEMAHVADGIHHGMRWRKEMIRLRRAGAPFTGTDKYVILEDPKRDPVLENFGLSFKIC